MEIHELNTFSGTPGAGDYLATDNGSDTSKISIKAITDPLNARIDNIIAGPASSAQEVIDARLGADGVTYPSLGDAIRTQIGDLNEAAVLDLSELMDHTSSTSGGITYTYTGFNKWTVSGTPSGTTFKNLVYSSIKTAPFKAGGKYKFWFTSTSENVFLQFYKIVNGTGSLVSQIRGNDSDFTEVTFPSDATGVQLRIRVNATVDASISLCIFEDNAIFEKISIVENSLDSKVGYVKTLTHNNDLNLVLDVGNYSYNASDLPSNAPENASSVLTVVQGFTTNVRAQYVSTYEGKLYQRLQRVNGNWEAWYEVSAGSGGGGTTVIENTYNISTSPTITTDTNGWLQAVDTDTSSETNKTDMSGAIMSMLTDTGYCHLSEGIFYVSGSIDMPANSTLCGCGDKTQIRLLQTVANGYCVKMKDFCTVKDVSFSGNYNALSPTEEGTRDAIWFVAGYESTPQTKTKHSVIENVKIRNFSGKGLYCYETSASPEDGLYVTNLFVTGCYAGVCVGRYSEFHKFTNICTSGTCYYGIVNNGGNNAFTACTIRAAYIGFYVDGTLPNSGHGVINGCEFVHIGGNQGSAITLSGVSNGFIISNTLIGYGSITVNSSKGINFSNCWLGPGTTGAGATIRISSGDLVMFNGCVFMSDSTLAPDIAVNNNTKVKFVNCYGADTGNAIAA